MPTYLRHYFVGMDYLAKGPAGLLRYKEDLGEPYSIMYCCRSCGEVHLRAPVTKDGVTLPWVPERTLCARCVGSMNLCDLPGLFWRSGRPEYNNLLPEEVLRHDYLAAIAFYERNHWL